MKLGLAPLLLALSCAGCAPGVTVKTAGAGLVDTVEADIAAGKSLPQIEADVAADLNSDVNPGVDAVLDVILSVVEVADRVTLGARARLSSGFPRTPVASAYYDARRDAWQPLFGPTNGERIPAFFQVDLRASKSFALGPDESLELYLDLLNATNRQNPEEIVYARDYAHRAYLTGLPILPVIGARLGW